MAEARQNLLVGAFVLIGISALGALIILFGRGPTWMMQGDTYPLTIHFEHVSGIREGNLVTARGMTIGRVIGVELTNPQRFDDGVDVHVAIENSFPIPIGATAETTEPVLGQGRPPIEIKVVDTGGEVAYLERNTTINGTVRSAMDSIFPSGVVTTFNKAARQIGDAAEALTPVLAELKKLLEDRDPAVVDAPGGLQGNLSTAVARLDASLRHFNDVLGDDRTKSQLRDTVANLHKMSQRGNEVVEQIGAVAADGQAMITDARELLGRADESIGTVQDEVRGLSAASRATLERLDLVLDNLVTVSQQISAGQGTLGRLVKDPELYESLVLSVERLTVAIDEFRALVSEWREGKIKVGI